MSLIYWCYFKVLVIPTFWLSKNLIDAADSNKQYFSAVVYGLVLTGKYLTKWLLEYLRYA